MSNIQIVQKNEIISNEKINLLKDQICKGATDSELQLFITNCNRTGLDPFQKQCWAVKRWDSSLNREVMAFQTGVDGFRVIANRSDKYAGQLGPYWCGPDGVWKDVWLENVPPVAAKVGVLRSDFKEPLWAVARFSSYAAKTKSGDLTKFWKTMPDLMIAKVAECLALRKSFPQDLSGIYSSEEMDQANEKQVEKQVEAIQEKIVEKPAQLLTTPAEVKKAKTGNFDVWADKLIFDAGNYEIKVGRFTGKKILDIPTSDIQKAIAHLKSEKEKNGSIPDAAQEFLDKAIIYTEVRIQNVEK